MSEKVLSWRHFKFRLFYFKATTALSNPVLGEIENILISDHQSEDGFLWFHTHLQQLPLVYFFVSTYTPPPPPSSSSAAGTYFICFPAKTEFGYLSSFHKWFSKVTAYFSLLYAVMSILADIHFIFIWQSVEFYELTPKLKVFNNSSVLFKAKITP